MTKPKPLSISPDSVATSLAELLADVIVAYHRHEWEEGQTIEEAISEARIFLGYAEILAAFPDADAKLRALEDSRQQRDFARDRMEFFRGQWQGARRRLGEVIGYHRRWAKEHGADPREVEQGLIDAGLIIGQMTPSTKPPEGEA